MLTEREMQRLAFVRWSLIHGGMPYREWWVWDFHHRQWFPYRCCPSCLEMDIQQEKLEKI